MKLCSSDNHYTTTAQNHLITASQNFVGVALHLELQYNTTISPELQAYSNQNIWLVFLKIWFVRQGQNKKKDNIIDDLLKVCKKGNGAVWRQQSPREIGAYNK